MKIFFALMAAVALVGCYGDSTGGAENRSSWRIDDGLCPGIEGGCAMSVPVAAGVEVAVDADVYCARPERDSEGRLVSECDLGDFDVITAGSVELRAVSGDESAGRLDVRVFTSSAGQVRFDLLRRGAAFDRVAMEVREPVDIRCGRVGAGGAQWDMRSLDTSGLYEVELYGADADPTVELGCALLDRDGLPLLSASGIEWEILEGSDLATVDDGGLFGDDRTTGARVYARVSSAGTIRLRAFFGEMSRELELDAR